MLFKCIKSLLDMTADTLSPKCIF